MNNFIGFNFLEELVKGKKNVVIIISDYIRFVLSRIIMLIILRRIRNVNLEIDVKIIVVIGFYRLSIREELIYKMGEEIVDNEDIVMYIFIDDKFMCKVGILFLGGDLYINKLVYEVEFLIVEGFIEFYFFVGFLGGRKSVFLGIVFVKIIMYNYCSDFIDSDNLRIGKLNNNFIYEDMVYVVKVVKLVFILNVVIDKDKKIIVFFVGDVEKVYIKGCRFVIELLKVNFIKFDIVVIINGGYLLD